MEAKVTDDKKAEGHPRSWDFAAGCVAGVVFAITVYEVWRVAPLKEEIEKLRGDGPASTVQEVRERPRSLALSEVSPVSANWIRHHLEGLAAAGSARVGSGAPTHSYVAAIRTESVTQPAPCFRLHLRAGGYTLAADHGFLVSGDETVYQVLTPRATTASELVYEVPLAGPGDYIFVPLLLLSRTGTIPQPITSVIVPAIEEC